jgi:hypothetical protein
MKPRIYLETTVISYLTAWRSPKLLMAAQQEATQRWWNELREGFDLFISEAVLVEAAAGDPQAAQRRLQVVKGVPVLDPTPDANQLAAQLVKKLRLPRKANLDAAHIALATVHAIDYLLTWNCRHIANPALQRGIAEVCAEMGFKTPVICTPAMFLKDPNDGDRSDS